VPALYQRLLRGVTSYQELGNRLLGEIETAQAFRQIEQVRELSRVLLSIPIREYQLIGQYYLVWCKCREKEYQSEVLERIAEQTQTYKVKALISRAALEIYQGKVEPALYFYVEALKAGPTASEYVAASRGIALAKSMEGFHGSALKDLESLMPLLKHAEPLIYYDVVNSYAVELIEHDRLSEARNVSLVAVSSPLGPFYPEWQDTLLDVRSKRKQRSTITISVPDFQQGYETEEAIEDNPIQEARVDAVIDFMTANLHKSITLDQLSQVASLSPSQFARVFKSQTGLSPITYLIKLRMEKAGHLLTTTFRSVKEVIAMVGYGNRHHFLHLFKRHFNTTPTAYRKRALRQRRNRY
jgi:AraC-like DNA-binding protein